jgi:hypothetical protein
MCRLHRCQEKRKREEVVVGDGRKCRSYRELMAKKKKKKKELMN